MCDSKYRIIVQNPRFIFDDQSRNFNGYNYKFVEKYCDGILLYARPWKYFKYRRKLKELGWNKKIYLKIGQANRHSDALVCFNGRPYLKANKPSAKYIRKKFFHVMDFAEKVEEINKALERGNVDYLLGYCAHDRYSAFFRRYFGNYMQKVISVPFGYADRFENKEKISKRINKCVALGSLNPIVDPLIKTDNLQAFKNYYSDHEYSHEVRKKISENAGFWKDCIDSMLPVYPTTKNNTYDAVEVLNKYSMFINDASVDEFPPARTYEGIACGCVMVAEQLETFKDMGFVDGINCIMFPKGDYDEMVRKIRYYMEHLEELSVIQSKSLELASSFSHKKIADRLYQEICLRIKE